jgi:hypothetical protein
MGAQHIVGFGGSVAEVSTYGALIGRPRPMTSLGVIRPGGAEQIVSNSIANPTVVTTLAPHGLTTGDRIFFTASTTSSPLLTATPHQVVTVITPTTFSVPVNVTVAGTAGAYDYSILSIPTTPGAAPLINVGRAHGLRVGDTVTIVASGSTPSLDGAQVVTAVDSATAFRVLTSATPTTVAGSTTAAHYSKTTFYSDVLDRGAACSGGALVIQSVIGTAPVTVTCNIEGSVDGTAWFNIPYALVATPRTFVVTALSAITTAVTTTYLLQELVFWRYLRLKQASSTNVILTLTATYIEG